MQRVEADAGDKLGRGLDIPQRQIGREARGDAAWQPVKPRKRQVSVALQAYAAMTTSAARGAVRDVSQIRRG